MIQFEHVSKVFGKNQILKDVNFTIDQGNFVTIIGASGCGKTTTLKMINRLIKPTTGEIYIGGENIRDKDILQLRRSMGYVIQQTGLFSHMTIRENIEIIPRLSKADPERTRTRTLELMDLVGMDPEIILMDEPFSALDPITRTQLQDELLGLQEELHKTIVFVTHDMDEAVKIADKICIMDRGEILQYDEPEQLLKNPCNEFVAQFVGKNRIWSSPEFIKARDIMIDRPICCPPELNLRKAVERMRFAKVDTLLVTDAKRQLLGLMRATDYRSILPHLRNHRATVGQAMDTQFTSASPDASIIDLLALVQEKNVSALPIVEESGKLCGLITRSSLMTTLSHQYLDNQEGGL